MRSRRAGTDVPLSLAWCGLSSQTASMTESRSLESNVSWHALPVGELIKKLGTDQDAGLRAEEVSARLTKFGPNRLPTAGKRSPITRFLMQINNVLIYVLLGAGVGKILLGEWLDASVILGVVIINALLGFVQEGKAEKALDSIRNMLSSEAMAVRDGKTRMVSAEELVPGDVVLLQSGDKIPGDIRLCEVKNLRVEEAGRGNRFQSIRSRIRSMTKLRSAIARAWLILARSWSRVGPRGLLSPPEETPSWGISTRCSRESRPWRLRCSGRSRGLAKSSLS